MDKFREITELVERPPEYSLTTRFKLCKQLLQDIEVFLPPIC